MDEKELDELSSLNAVRQRTTARMDEIKRGMRELREDYAAWDDARERRMYARLDQADAKLREWLARDGERPDILADLKEQTALARARLAEWQASRHERKAEEAMEDAVRHFDKAFEAAAKRYK